MIYQYFHAIQSKDLSFPASSLKSFGKIDLSFKTMANFVKKKKNTCKYKLKPPNFKDLFIFI